MKSKLVWGAVGVAIVLTVGFLYNKFLVAPKIKFEGLTLTDLNGQSVSLNNFEDKKLFVNFMATWCGPCMAELPSLEAAQQTLASENFLFLLVSDEPIQKLKYLQQKVNLPVLHSAQKLSDLKIFSIPTSYLLNKKGEIVFKKTGGDDWASQEMLHELRQASN